MNICFGRELISSASRFGIMKERKKMDGCQFKEDAGRGYLSILGTYYCGGCEEQGVKSQAVTMWAWAGAEEVEEIALQRRRQRVRLLRTSLVNIEY